MGSKPLDVSKYLVSPLKCLSERFHRLIYRSLGLVKLSPSIQVCTYSIKSKGNPETEPFPVHFISLGIHPVTSSGGRFLRPFGDLIETLVSCLSMNTLVPISTGAGPSFLFALMRCKSA